MATSAPKETPKAGPNTTSEAAPAKSRKKLFFILGAIVLLAVTGGGAAWYFLGANASHKTASGAHNATPAKPPVFMTLESFTVNLQADEGQQQFLQIGITLQVADQAQADLLKLYMPQVRSRLLMLLSSKKASELLHTDGKKKLSSELVAQLKQPFSAQGPEPQVLDVFFTSFVIQ